MRGILIRIHAIEPVGVIVAAHSAKELHSLAPFGFGLAPGHLLPHDFILQAFGSLHKVEKSGAGIVGVTVAICHAFAFAPGAAASPL
jgi:hypothetical protein